MSDFVEDVEVREIGQKLIEVWSTLFSHIVPDKILWARDTGPITPRGSRAAGQCIRVRPPYNLLNPNIRYIIAVLPRAKWTDLDDKQKAALIIHELLHIPLEFGEALVDHDVKDFSLLIDSLGSDYLARTDLPNFLDPSSARGALAKSRM